MVGTKLGTAGCEFAADGPKGWTFKSSKVDGQGLGIEMTTAAKSKAAALKTAVGRRPALRLSHSPSSHRDLRSWNSKVGDLLE